MLKQVESVISVIDMQLYIEIGMNILVRTIKHVVSSTCTKFVTIIGIKSNICYFSEQLTGRVCYPFYSRFYVAKIDLYFLYFL